MENIFEKYANRTPSIIDEEKFKKYAVFLPLIKKEEDYHILFEIRAYHMRRQPGEICFPGGKIDKSDIDPKYTAYRETFEELGIQQNDITHIFPLDYMMNSFGTMIYPFAGIIKNEERILPNPAEVAKVFTVPLSFFKNTEPECYKINFKVEPEKNFPFHSITGGENYNWQIRHMDEYFYYYKDYTIWGLTAYILKNFIEIIKKENLKM
ncbi:NUDIX hydrolase [Heyndrickxia sp. NPDC080065]|uniref:NUDIX hydrolase n=1 Tax=Heyndrickxia sp. NPDC080065 TaxID=3390568 RepID=UPI003CFEFEC4